MKKLHILILLLLTLSLTGCLFPVKVPYNTGDKYQSVTGFQKGMHNSSIKIGVSCNTLEFDIDNVGLKIYWAVIEDFMPYFDYENKDIYYYLGIDTRINVKDSDFITSDLNNISDFITLDIFDKNIFDTSDNYIASFNDKGGIDYNYFKEYHIPAEAFKENNGSIKLCIYSIKMNENGELLGHLRAEIDILYSKLDLSTVKFRGEWREN